MLWSDDGRGVVNTVRTTGIYCRAGCTARPKPANTAPLGSAAAAEAAGYRPCLRCRPDHLPVAPVDERFDQLVINALDLIADGYLDEHREAELAARIGVTDRHLRRLFGAAVGATPSQVATSRRAHFARLLLDDTDLTVTDIAFAAGFGSVRRMNDVMRRTFRFTPSELRAKRSRGDRSSVDGGLRLRFRLHRPLDLPRHLAVLAERAIPGVEVVDAVAGGSYRRAALVCGHPAMVEVRATDPSIVHIVAHLPAVTGLIELVARCRRVFRLDHITDGPTGDWSPFEAAVRAAVVADRTDATDRRHAQPVLAELAARYGPAVPGAAARGIFHAFPDAEHLRSLTPGSVAGLSPAGHDRLAALVAGSDAIR